jgi:hypothetical protein
MNSTLQYSTAPKERRKKRKKNDQQSIACACLTSVKAENVYQMAAVCHCYRSIVEFRAITTIWLNQRECVYIFSQFSTN